MTIRAIEHKTLDWVRWQGLIEEGDTVLLALSGGADSVCLARVLLALRGCLGIQVRAAHYNHQLRGEASGRDEAFVCAFCNAFDIPLVVGTGDVAGEAARSGRGIEETAREMRYAFLEATAQALGANKIATGHHADDNVETVLLHLIRGAGIRGLAGIPPQRGQVVRPILALERAEVEAYLSELGQDFVTDATNADMTIRRNALRHQVLPLLRAENPNLAGTVLRQSELLRQDNWYLDEVATGAFERGAHLSVAELTALDPAIASRVIAFAVRAVGGEANAAHVWQILSIAAGNDPSAETHVRGDVTVWREYDRLMFEPTRGAVPTFESVVLPAEGMVLLPEVGLFVGIGADFVKNPETIRALHFKSAAICGRITVRPRQAGDQLRLPGRGGTKTVKKLLIEARIPARERESLPVFADDLGVIAVDRIGIDERVAPGPGDKILTIVVGDETCTKM
ncbi:MAG: tRNA lysidine(34) synthetase TilS [Oscillospiraceae bacterium]|nr:tRNA lysidine(34) synthetase TilS [Oscillospiraceae bacterium]